MSARLIKKAFELKVLMLLGLFGFQFSAFNSLFAQDAFYIYRNDGNFDGFFYDQVQRIGYSKIDLEGMEHDEYVIQEVETVDSLYRIPLCAIDSIGFVQPEIRFSPQLRMMDELGHTDWIDHIAPQGDGTALLYFKAGMPESLKPEVGNVLVGFDEGVFGNGGYGGKVQSVFKVAGAWCCQMGDIESWGDIFDQVITVEQIGTDAEGNVRRRVAGFAPDGSVRAPNRVSGNYDLTLFNWSGRLQKELYHSGNQSVNVGLDLGLTATAQAVYNISGVFSKRAYFKVVFCEGFSAGLSVHASVSGGHEWPVATPLDLLPAVKFPAFFPIFECDPKPKGFVRINGSADIGVQLPKYDFGFSQTLIYDSELEEPFAFSWGNLDKNEDNPEVLDGELTGFGLGFVLNGFVQFGSKVSLAVKNNSWLNSLLECSVGLEIYAGPKMEAEVNFNLSGDGSYEVLKDSKVELSQLSFDRELKYSWRVGRRPRQERSLWSDTQKFGSVAWYFLPNFLETKADDNEAAKQFRATVYPRRMVLLPSNIGIGAYDKDGKLLIARYGKKYSFSNTFEEFSATFKYDEFPGPGKYSLRPIIESGSTPYSAKSAAAEVEIPAYLTIETDSIVLESKADVQRIPFESNVDDVRYLGADGDYFQASIEKDQNGQRHIVITPEENKSIYTQRGMLFFEAYDNDGRPMRDTLIVRQYGTDDVANLYQSIRAHIKWTALKNGHMYERDTERDLDISETYSNEEFPSTEDIVFSRAEGSNHSEFSIVRHGETVVIDVERTEKAVAIEGDDGQYHYRLHLEYDVSPERTGSGLLKGSCSWTLDLTGHIAKQNTSVYESYTQDREVHLRFETLWGKGIETSVSMSEKRTTNRVTKTYDGQTYNYTYDADITYTMKPGDKPYIYIDLRY